MRFTTMKTIRTLLAALVLLLAPALHAINVAEPGGVSGGDFPNTSAGVTATYT